MLAIFRICHQFSKIIPKANTQSTTCLQQKSKQIAQFFKLKITPSATQQQIQKKYLAYLGTGQAKQKITYIRPVQFLMGQQKYQIIQYTKQQISKHYTKITPQLQNIIDTFFGYLAYIYITNRQLGKQHNFQKQLNKCLISYNQFFLLITPSIKNCVNYLKMVGMLIASRNKSLYMEEFTPFYRICVDELLAIPINKYSQEQIVSVVRSFGFTDINHLYYERSIPAIKYFWNGIKNTWHLDPISRKHLLISIIQLNFYSQPILSQIQHLLIINLSSPKKPTKNQLTPTKQLIIYLSILIKYKKYNGDNIDKIQDCIIKLTQKCKQQKLQNLLYLNTGHLFYMAGIWIKQYWFQYANFIEHDSYFNLLYRLKVLRQLFIIYNKQIPKEIIEKITPIIDKKLQNQPTNISEQDDFVPNIFKSQSRLSCQSQITNSLRLLNMGSISTEVYISVFKVDILIDNKIVVEINGNMHLLTNLDTLDKQYNLKTLFRSNVLKKLGYEVIDVDLENFSEGSFELTAMIHNIYTKTKKDKNLDTIQGEAKQENKTNNKKDNKQNMIKI